MTHGNKKIENVEGLIDLVQTLYDEEKIEWTPYCKIRNGLIDLKDSNN